MEHGLCAGAAQGFEIRVQADGRQGCHHQELADGLQGGGQSAGNQAQAGQARHGQEAQNEPGEHRHPVDFHAAARTLAFLFQVHIDGRKNKHRRDNGQSPGQLDHGGEVTGSLAEGIACSHHAGGIVYRRPGPQTEGSIGKTHHPAQNREQQNHHRVEQEGGRQAVGNVHIRGFDHRGNGRNGGTAADTGTGIDQTAGFPVQPQCFADQRPQAEAGSQGEDHHRQGKFAYGKHRADVQAGTQQDDGELQYLFGGEADAGGRRRRGLAEMVYQHPQKQSDYRRTDQMDSGIFFQNLHEFGSRCQNQGQAQAGGVFLNGFHRFFPPFFFLYFNSSL